MAQKRPKSISKIARDSISLYSIELHKKRELYRTEESRNRSKSEDIRQNHSNHSLLLHEIDKIYPEYEENKKVEDVEGWNVSEEFLPKLSVLDKCETIIESLPHSDIRKFKNNINKISEKLPEIDVDKPRNYQNEIFEKLPEIEINESKNYTDHSLEKLNPDKIHAVELCRSVVNKHHKDSFKQPIKLENKKASFNKTLEHGDDLSIRNFDNDNNFKICRNEKQNYTKSNGKDSIIYRKSFVPQKLCAKTTINYNIDYQKNQQRLSKYQNIGMRDKKSMIQILKKKNSVDKYEYNATQNLAAERIQSAWRGFCIRVWIKALKEVKETRTNYDIDFVPDR